jgi:aspartyl-tRNA(Asn)/glutamyl-tRNA(Gln) amidotransferase subunit A
MPGEELFYLSVSELAKRIESKKLSPVELTQVYLDRSQKFAPHFNAYAMLTPEIALEQAKAAEKEIHRGHYRGPLHGIPYAAKDLLAVKGIPTTWGAKPYANQVFDYNATVIEHLKNVGAVMIGKASMIELAGGSGYRFASASLQGEAKNPWDPTCWTCGSSSGSGAIVAAGLAAFAIGTETWGSIICPSAFCGISGLRPTYGRVSRYGAMALAPSMDKIGPMARSAEDCARIFAVIAGHDQKDRGTIAIDKAAFTYSPSVECFSEETFQRHEGRCPARWPLGRRRLSHCPGGSGSFFPLLDSFRKAQRADRPAGADSRLLKRAILCHRLPAGPQSPRNPSEENGRHL